MKYFYFILWVSALLLCAACDRKVDDGGAVGGPAAPAGVSPQFEAFSASADSTLRRLDSQLARYDTALENPGRRRHAIRQRRQAIQARYRMEKLQERLEKRRRSYRLAVEGLNRIESGNPVFIRQYQQDLQLLDSTITVFINDTLH